MTIVFMKINLSIKHAFLKIPGKISRNKLPNALVEKGRALIYRDDQLMVPVVTNSDPD